MKQFDLEQALEGAPLITRDGRKVENFRLNWKKDPQYPYRAKMITVFDDGRVRKRFYQYNDIGINAAFWEFEGSDLFMMEVDDEIV